MVAKDGVSPSFRSANLGRRTFQTYVGADRNGTSQVSGEIICENKIAQGPSFHLVWVNPDLIESRLKSSRIISLYHRSCTTCCLVRNCHMPIGITIESIPCHVQANTCLYVDTPSCFIHISSILSLIVYPNLSGDWTRLMAMGHRWVRCLLCLNEEGAKVILK